MKICCAIVVTLETEVEEESDLQRRGVRVLTALLHVPTVSIADNNRWWRCARGRVT